MIFNYTATNSNNIIDLQSIAEQNNDIVDNVFALDGNDTILGEYQIESVYAGSGNDIIQMLEGAEKVLGEEGNDIISLGSSGNSYASPISVLVHGGSGNDNISIEEAERNKIFGGSGDDNVSIEELGKSTVVGGNGEDIISITVGEDIRVFGGNGNDILKFRDLNYSTVDSGNGEDTLEVDYLYNSTIDSGNANDKITGYGEDSFVIAGGGSDTIIFSGSGNRIFAGRGNDYIEILNSSSNRVFGGEGDDYLRVGSDYIIGNNYGGSVSNTYLSGGNGMDVFDFSDGISYNKNNIISDFNLSQDTLILGSSNNYSLNSTRRGLQIINNYGVFITLRDINVNDFSLGGEYIQYQ